MIWPPATPVKSPTHRHHQPNIILPTNIIQLSCFIPGSIGSNSVTTASADSTVLCSLVPSPAFFFHLIIRGEQISLLIFLRHCWHDLISGHECYNKHSPKNRCSYTGLTTSVFFFLFKTADKNILPL